MKIITRPTVSLFSSQIFHPVEGYEIPHDGDTPTKIGAFTAKTCYRSFGEQGRSNTENQQAIVSSGHGRILEHVVYGLHVTGISRALSMELLTHVVGISKSQESTRYVDMQDAGYVLEPHLASLWEKYRAELVPAMYGMQELQVNRPTDGNLPNPMELNLLGVAINSARQDFVAYEREVDLLTELNPEGLTGTALRKWARGKARNSLPHGLETRMVLTGNLRAWRHFIAMRSAADAEDEIRRLAAAIFQVLQPLAPLYFEDFEGVEVVRGIPVYRPKHWKV